MPPRRAPKASTAAAAGGAAGGAAAAADAPLDPEAEKKRWEEFALKKKRGIFTEDLRRIMYGYGDDADPLKETVDVVEEICIEYILEMTQKAAEIGAEEGKVHVNDLLALVRRHPRKYARATELLRVDREIKKAREEHTQNKHKNR
eukprot:PRCOL_00006976-RA